MSAYVDARPAGIDLLFRPNVTLTLELNWPAGSLVGRSFSSTLGGTALAVTVNGDLLTIEATDTQTGTIAIDDAVDWLLLEDIDGTPEPIMVGTWAASNDAAARSQQTVTVTQGSAQVSVQANVAQSSIAALDGRVDNLDSIAFDHAIRLNQLDPWRSGSHAPDDHNLVSWVYDPVIVNESALMTNGQLHLVKLPIRADVTVATLHWYVETVATSPVANQNRVGLYSSAGSRLADVVVNSVLSSTGLKSTSLGSVELAAGFVWAAFLFNASTPPRLGRAAVLASIHELGAVGLTAATGRFAINGTGQTTLPATRTPASNNIGSGNFPGPWCALA